MESNSPIDILVKMFLGHGKTQTVFRSDKSGYQKRVSRFIHYCYSIAERNKGIQISQNGHAVLLYYLSNDKKMTLHDHLRYIRIALSIPLKMIRKSLAEEKLIKRKRIKGPFVYAWFLVQDDRYNGIDSLLELRDHIFEVGRMKNAPVILETSEAHLVKLYLRAGFEIYEEVKQPERTLWFFKADPI